MDIPTDKPENPVAKYVVIGLGVLVATAGLLAVFLPRERADISYRVLTADLSRSDQVIVTFEVDKPPLATAECAVAAFNDPKENKADQRASWRLTGIVVGPVPDQRVTRRTVVVRTESQASSAAVAECRITRSR